MVICFFRQVKAKFAKDEGKGTSRGVTADCKVLFKCPIDAIGTIVSFEGNSSGIKVPLLNEVFETMRTTWDIGTCSNPKANQKNQLMKCNKDGVYLLPSHFTYKEFPFRTRLLRISQSVHDDVANVASAFSIGDISELVKDIKQIHQVRAKSNKFYKQAPCQPSFVQTNNRMFTSLSWRI